MPKENTSGMAVLTLILSSSCLMYKHQYKNKYILKKSGNLSQKQNHDNKPSQ